MFGHAAPHQSPLACGIERPKTDEGQPAGRYDARCVQADAPAKLRMRAKEQRVRSHPRIF